MSVRTFINNLKNAGYWDEYCKICRKKFPATDNEDVCKECQEIYDVDKYGDEIREEPSLER